MVTDEQVTEVRRLLALGLSIRKVREETGVSRWKIAEIKAGNHTRKPKRHVSGRTLTTPRRCATCRGMIEVVPCIKCTIDRERDLYERG